MNLNENEVISYLWQITGDDRQIIEQCSDDLKNKFSIIGFIVFILFILCFISGWISLDLMSSNIFINIPCSLFFAWMLTNIYLVILSTFSKPVLPTRKQTIIKNLSIVVRIILILLISVYVSKTIETKLLGSVINWRNLVINKLDAEPTFSQKLSVLCSIAPYSLSWLATIFLVYLFFLPIIIKARLNLDSQYYVLKKDIDNRIILNNYEEFKKGYVRLLKPYDPEVSYHEEYCDAPFNISKHQDQKVFTKLDDIYDFYNP